MTIKFTPRNTADGRLIAKIAKRAAQRHALVATDVSLADLTVHHQMNVSACHENGNPLRLGDLLEADDFNFAHDVFGIDRNICRDTGKLLNHFSPRFSARVAA